MEPLAAALMGAGFFIFASALAGGTFWSLLERELWSRFQNRPSRASAAAPAAFLRGSTDLGLTPAGRRLKLASEIEALASAGAGPIVLEAWLDDASQQESSVLLDELLESAAAAKGRFSAGIKLKVGELKESLNADLRLAQSISRAARVILPAAVENVSGPSSLTHVSAVWGRGAYQVSRKSLGLQRLERGWRLVRAPLPVFREAAAAVAALPAAEAPAGSMVAEAQGVFQVRQSWVNGLGLEAALNRLEVPSKGLHFLWREGRLNALEIKGARYPMSRGGSFWLPPGDQRARVQDLGAFNPASLGTLKGRAVFYQPWPELLAGPEAFARQRELFAGLLEKRLEGAPTPSAGELRAWVILWALCVSGLWAWSSRLAWLLPMLLLGANAYDFLARRGQAARPVGVLASACLLGLGLRVLKQRRLEEQRGHWLRSHLAPSAQEHWRALYGTAESVLPALYLAVDLSTTPASSREAWKAWALRRMAFCDRNGIQRLGLILTCSPGQPWPLAAIDELRHLLPGAALAAAAGSLEFKADPLFEGIYWLVDGPPKQTAWAMLERASGGELLVTEEDYAILREKIRVQIKPGPPGIEKVLNIVEFIG